VKFWIVLAAVVGYSVQYVWDLPLDWFIIRRVHPFTIFMAITSPGYLFLHTHFEFPLTCGPPIGMKVHF
jgi:hypothetical protein